MQVKQALEIMRSRNGLCSANTSFGAARLICSSSHNFHLSLWAWTGVGTGRVCLCSKVGLNSGPREIGGSINRGKFLHAFAWEEWEEISENVTQRI